METNWENVIQGELQLRQSRLSYHLAGSDRFEYTSEGADHHEIRGKQRYPRLANSRFDEPVSRILVCGKGPRSPYQRTGNLTWLTVSSEPSIRDQLREQVLKYPDILQLVNLDYQPS